MLAPPLLVLEGLIKIYNRGKPSEVQVLRGASLTLARGEVVALVAPSGAGKSTLLHIAGLLDTADAGLVRIDGPTWTRLSDGLRTQVRRADVGFIYQFHHLLPEFSALENIVLPQLANGVSRREADARARGLLDRVGVGARADHRPAELRGRAAAGGVLPGAGKRAEGAFGGRADRQPGPRHLGSGVWRADGGGARDRACGADRDAHLALAARMDRVVRLQAGRVV